MSLDLTDLKIITLVPGSSNRQEIAERLGLSPASVTQRIKKIESSIGHKVITTLPNFSLTKAGEKLYEFALKTDKMRAEFRDDMDFLRRGQDTLRIMIDSSQVINDLPAAVDAALQKYPNVRVEVLEGDHDSTMRNLQNEKIDIGISWRLSPSHGILFEEYRREKFCLLVQLSHPLVKTYSNSPISLYNTKECKFVGLAKGNYIEKFFQTSAPLSNLDLNHVVRVTNLECAANFVVFSEAVITVTPESIARRYQSIHPTKVTCISLSDTWAEIPLFCCTRDSQDKPPVVQYITNFLRNKSA